MSDTSTSGNTPAAPAPDSAATSSAPPASFGTGRGSGLARGKRASQPIAAPSSAAAGTYKPTAIQIIAVETEYKNPFAPAGAVPAPTPAEPPVPATNESKPRSAETPIETPVPATPAPAPTPAPVADATRPAEPQAPQTPRVEADEPEAKAELNILPPANLKRPAQSWESESFARDTAGRSEPRRDRREDRPVFKPEKRELRQASEIRADSGARSSEPRPYAKPAAASRAPETETPRKAGGLLGWLKGLFSSTPAETKKPAREGQPGREGGGRHDDGGHRRRRGGRSRSGGPGFQGNPEGGSSEGRGGEGGGGGRRRRRGGRGRRGGGPRPEGGSGPAS